VVSEPKSTRVLSPRALGAGLTKLADLWGRGSNLEKDSVSAELKLGGSGCLSELWVEKELKGVVSRVDSRGRGSDKEELLLENGDCRIELWVENVGKEADLGAESKD